MRDLAKFKVLKEDDTHIHIAHPSGKRLILDKKQLSKKGRDAVQKFAKGGTVGAEQNETTVIPDKGWGKIIIVASKDKEKAQQFNEGGTAETDSVMDGYVPPPVQLDPQAQVLMQELSAPVVPSSLAPAMPAAAEPIMPPAAPTAPAAPMQPDPMQQSFGAKGNAFDMMVEGEKGVAAATAQKGAEMTKAIDQTEQKIAKMKTQEELFNEFEKTDQAFLQAAREKKVDPNRLYKNMSTGAQIGASIGMILSGFGAGLSGQENAAMKIMQNAIERDIDAQKNDQSQAMNIWKMNREAYQSKTAADIATKNQLYTSLQHQMERAAANAMGPEASGRLKAAIGAIEQQRAQLKFQMSLFDPQGQTAPGSEEQFRSKLNGLNMLNPALHKEAMERYLPGMGVASKPVPEAEHKQLIELQEFRDEMREAIALQQKWGKAGAWTPAEATKAAQLKESLPLKMNTIAGISRLNKEEIHSFGQQVGNIGGINIGGTLSGLKNIDTRITNKQKLIMDSYGVRPFAGTVGASGGQQSPEAAKAWLQANPNAPQAPAIRAKLGIK
jgi:hypothetical protein